MAVVLLPAVSTEYLYVRGIQAFDADSPDHATDPTALPVQVALLAAGTDPAEDDWTAAEWVDATSVRILTGAGGALAPTEGRYIVWLRITGAVEQPERPVGQLVVS